MWFGRVGHWTVPYWEALGRSPLPHLGNPPYPLPNPCPTLYYSTRMALHYTALNNIKLQCSAVQCSAVQCSAVQCSAVQCSAVQCSAVQCSDLTKHCVVLQQTNITATHGHQLLGDDKLSDQSNVFSSDTPRFVLSRLQGLFLKMFFFVNSTFQLQRNQWIDWMWEIGRVFTGWFGKVAAVE